MLSFHNIPFVRHVTALLSEHIQVKDLNLVSKVGTLNMKMLDHLLEIRDNPVRLQLLESFGEKKNM